MTTSGKEQDPTLELERILRQLRAADEQAEGFALRYEMPAMQAMAIFATPSMSKWLADYRAAHPDVSEEEAPRIFHDVAYPFAMALGWLAFLDTKSKNPDPSPYHFRIARHAIAEEKESAGVSDGTVGDEEAYALARELMNELAAARAFLALETATPDQFLTPASEDGMLWLDALAACFLDSIRLTEAAGDLRIAARRRWVEFSQQQSLPSLEKAAIDRVWRLWADSDLSNDGLPPLRFAVALARFLWRARVSPRLSTTPTVQLEMTRVALSTWGRRGATLSPDGKQLLRDGEVIADIPALPAQTLVTLTDATRGLGSLDMARAIPYLVRRGWEQRGLPNDADVLIDGGLEGFAKEALGIENSNKGTERARIVLEAGRLFHRAWPGGEIHGLWLFSYAASKGQRGAELCLTLSPALRPHSHFGRKLSPWLAPVLAPPPMVGSPRDHGSQAFFAMRFMIELVEHRIELPDGGALLTRENLERMSREVGLPIPTLDKALDRWRRDGDDGPAFLEVDGDPKRAARFMLADRPPYRAARAFLLRGAQITAEATASAKRSLIAKDRRRQGRRPRPK